MSITNNLFHRSESIPPFDPTTMSFIFFTNGNRLVSSELISFTRNNIPLNTGIFFDIRLGRGDKDSALSPWGETILRNDSPAVDYSPLYSPSILPYLFSTRSCYITFLRNQFNIQVNGANSNNLAFDTDYSIVYYGGAASGEQEKVSPAEMFLRVTKVKSTTFNLKLRVAHYGAHRYHNCLWWVTGTPYYT